LTRNAYSFAGTFDYDARGAFYLKGGASFGFGDGRVSNNATGGVGSFTNDNYSVGVRLGKVFTLVDTFGARPSAMISKAPPKSVANGYAFGVDLSAGLGYSDWRDRGFTDSSGFSFGTERVHFGDVNGRAKLFLLFPGAGFIWMPYVAGTVDQLFSYSHTFEVPAQAATTADTFAFGDAKTFWGTQLGVDARAPNGWIVGAKGFYTASADTNIAGGSAYVRLPINCTPKSAWARY
jgi:hypothetical protein